MSSVCTGVWLFIIVPDVCSGTVFLVVDGEDVETGVYDTGDYFVRVGDGRRDI